LYFKSQNIVNQYLKLSEKDKVKFELAAIDTWAYWSRVTWVRFSFYYTDNKLNRKLGRVGKASGTRYGTRNLDLIPTNDKPRSRNKEPKNYRYYDTLIPSGKSKTIRGADGRYTTNKNQAIKGHWRSFNKNLLIVISGVWSYDRGKFVANFDDFTIKNQPTS
jgi:hypothetical protein